MHPGRLMLRNDSLMNLSPETYVEFVRPRDQRLFNEFGGGAIHFCGRGDHYIEAMSEMTGLYQVDMSQPHLNDMEKIFRNTVDKGINLNGALHEPVAAARQAGRALHGRVYLK
jgi:uroporphyrinogen-III decarboxylase